MPIKNNKNAEQLWGKDIDTPSSSDDNKVMVYNADTDSYEYSNQFADYHSLTQTISYTQDEERRFFKDDFSVDSSENYFDLFSTVPFAYSSGRMRCRSGTPENVTFKKNSGDSTYGRYSADLIPDPGPSTPWIGIAFGYQNTTAHSGYMIGIGNYNSKNTVFLIVIYNGERILVEINNGVFVADTKYRLDVVWTPANYKVYINGSLKYTGTTQLTQGHCGICSYYTGGYVYDFEYVPSVSYSDPFTSDTVSGANGRYQAVTGTVAYDDVNKRMNVTTATGANGKASGRLKSYKFCEGSQIFDVLLPTGADGDLITLVTHSANGLMTDGIGVGLQSDGAGNWNLATLSRTTVTEGADSGLDDADVARIEIEKDITGTYWYYIYNAAGTKPTTATGKLFTTLSEGYTGWYTNGAGATTQTFAIDNISIRAESIVGRTNVQVEEPFWFRDEFGEDSLGRYPHSSIWSISNGNLIRSVGGDSPIWFTNKQISNFDVTFDFKPHLTDNTDSNRKFWFVFGSNRNEIEGYNNGIRYLLRLQCRTSSTVCKLDKFDVTIQFGLHTFGSTTDIFDGQEGFTSVRILLVNGVLSLYINGVQLGTTYNIGENVVGYIGAYGWGFTDVYEIDNLEISGTRVYNKPIHRGAMLETYHDGTQEVVGTTFVDDCQWDRRAEYIKSSGITHNAAGGYYNIPTTTADGYMRVNGAWNPIDGDFRVVYSIESKSDYNGFVFEICGVEICHLPVGGVGRVYISRANLMLPFSADFTAGQRLEMRVKPLTSGTVRIQVYNADNGIRISSGSLTNSSANQTFINGGIVGVGTRASSTVRIYSLRVIASASDATNGIAACIPPIGGGARYDTQESITQTIDMSGIVSSDLKAYSSAISTNAAETALLRITAKNDTDDTSVYSDGTTKYWDVVMDGTVINTRKALETNFNDMGDSVVFTHSTDAGVPDGCIYVRETICKPITIVMEEDLT